MEYRGWSKEEVKHAHTVLENAEATKRTHVRINEHLHLWLLVVAILFVGLAMATLVFPLLLFAALLFTLPVMFILGACCGLLLVHALRSLRHRHHMAAFVTLITLTLISMTISISIIQSRFLVIPGAQESSAFLLSVTFTAGLCVPYITDRRIHGLA